MCAAIFAIACSTPLHGAELTMASRTRSQPVPGATIVGRAACKNSTWLLADSSELIEVREGLNAVVHAVAGLSNSDRPWGLACLTDDTLWTMASSRDLVRLDRTGRVQERFTVPLPRIALFAAGDRLLFQPLPIATGASALMTGPARQPAASRPWPGLTSHGASTREAQLAQNLVACGIAYERQVPCWFINQTEFTVSDGASARTVKLPTITIPEVDRAMPVRDIALAADKWFWYVLAGRDRVLGRPAGVRLVRAHEQLNGVSSIDLRPGARVILSATDSRCRVLLADGSIAEVAVTP
jgi:hypothetical protein